MVALNRAVATAAMLLGLVIAPAVEAQILAIPDIEVSGLAASEGRETVDCLVEAIRATGAFTAVAREVGSGSTHVLRGSLGLTGNTRVLDVVLTEVSTGSVLLSRRESYARLADLRDGCPALAGLVSESLRAAREIDRPAPPREPVSVAGYVRFGQVAVSRSATLGGGSYLYSEVAVEVDGYLGLSSRYTTSLLPDPFQDHLIDVRLRMNAPISDEVWLGLGLAWMLSAGLAEPPVHWIGLRICPVYSGDQDGLAFELLPLAIFLDPSRNEWMVTVELVSIGFRAFRTRS